MSAQELRGLPVAKELRAKTAQRVQALQAAGVVPKLAVVVATDNGATRWYVESIAKHARKAEVACDVVDLGASATSAEVAEALRMLAADDAVHGIILQTPLPAGVDAQQLVELIPVAKDVDGANPASFALLAAGRPSYPAATAQAVIEVLEHYQVPLAGKDVAVVGRSLVVGQPLAQLLLQRNATVTICHSRTADLAKHTRHADVVAAAVGCAGLITAEHVHAGAVVVDVGTNVDAGGNLVGDVDAASVQFAVAALTPVPGGVGTVTTALLIDRAAHAAQQTL